MKNKLLFSLLIFINTIAAVQNTAANLQNILIPKPVSLITGDGNFILPSNLSIIFTKNEELKKIAGSLAKQLTTAGNAVAVTEGNTAVANSFFLNLSADKSISAEGYRLQVAANGVTISASAPAGIFLWSANFITIITGTNCKQSK